MVPTERTTANGQKLKYMKFHLNIRKKNQVFFIVRVVKHWTKLPREIVEISLNIYNT